jgi:hypothetical protein
MTRCGVPQVIVAGWVDCYDFAQRANELGVGIWANQADAYVPFYIFPVKATGAQAQPSYALLLSIRTDDPGRQYPPHP